VKAIAPEPRRIELLAPELGRRASIGGHRALPAGCDRHDDAVSSRCRAGKLDAVARELPRGQFARGVRTALTDVHRLGAEGRRPRRDVRRLAARTHARRRRLVVPGDERTVEADDHVEDQIAEGDQAHA
jgi:hypothetical protein